MGVAVLLALWWALGALVFAALEGPIETSLLQRVSALRAELVIDLATDLRKVRAKGEGREPFTAYWNSIFYKELAKSIGYPGVSYRIIIIIMLLLSKYSGKEYL